MYQRGNFLTNFFTNSPIFKTTIKRICQLFVGRVTFLEGGPSKSGEKKKKLWTGFFNHLRGEKNVNFFFLYLNITHDFIVTFLRNNIMKKKSYEG